MLAKKLENLLKQISVNSLPHNAKEFHDLDNLFNHIVTNGSEHDVVSP